MLSRITNIDKCYVVCKSSRENEPMFVAVDLMSRLAYQRAKSFVLSYNQSTRSGRAVIRPARAVLSWDSQKRVSTSRRQG